MKEELQPLYQKIKNYCAYQERCHSEVKNKLYSFGIYKNEVELLLTELIQDNYLNEERFALAYAKGKFNLKKWGKEKIKFGLKQKKISDYCIRKALASIDTNVYDKNFDLIAAKKLKELKSEKNIFIRKRKLQDYLRQKGYELKLINSYLKNI